MTTWALVAMLVACGGGDDATGPSVPDCGARNSVERSGDAWIVTYWQLVGNACAIRKTCTVPVASAPTAADAAAACPL